MNFACPTPQPPAIPQMQQSAPKDNQASINTVLPPGFNPAQLSQIPPPFLPGSNNSNASNSSSFSNFSNYGNFSQSNQSWGTNQQQNVRNQQQQNTGGGPKPIRFSLQAKRGGANHGFGNKSQQQSSNTAGSVNMQSNFTGSNATPLGVVGGQQNGMGYQNQNSGPSYAKVAAASASNSIQQNNTGTEFPNQNNLNNSFASHNSSSASNKTFQSQTQHYGTREPSGGVQSQPSAKDISQAMDPSDWPDSLQ